MNTPRLNENAADDSSPEVKMRQALFAVMFVSCGMACFIWQSIRSGSIFFKARKPIHAIVFFQAVLGVILTFLTLLDSLISINCTFILLFSVVCVNLADILLQLVLLWKAYLGNNRSKIVLVVGSIPLLGLVAFIGVNIVVDRAHTIFDNGVCTTSYTNRIVVIKSTLDFTSNAFLSACFILVIYRHYRILGSSVQKSLIRDGLIYCFGVCLSNVLTGLLLVLRVLGESTAVLYTIDWYLASYLIIKQLRCGHKIEDDDDDDDQRSSISQLEGGQSDTGRPVFPSLSKLMDESQTRDEKHRFEDGNRSPTLRNPSSSMRWSGSDDHNLVSKMKHMDMNDCNGALSPPPRHAVNTCQVAAE